MTVKISKNEWQSCQVYEKKSWGDDIYIHANNNEIIKQNVYAQLLEITNQTNFSSIDLNQKTVLDVGCGPISLLLRCHNFKKAVGVEPLFYNEKVDKEYLNKNIQLIRIPAEEMNFNENEFDEVWMYNVLQHTYDPEKILQKLNTYAKCIKIFEWLDTPPHEGHPQESSEEFFVKTLSLQPNEYKIVHLSTYPLYGKAIVVNRTR